MDLLPINGPSLEDISVLANPDGLEIDCHDEKGGRLESFNRPADECCLCGNGKDIARENRVGNLRGMQ